MASFSSLNTGLTGLNAQRRVMDIIGHNVANEATRGYHRQSVSLRAVGSPTAGVFAGQGNSYGVEVLGVDRAFDQMRAARAVREQGANSFSAATSATLQRVEGLFPEPSDVGIANQLSEFWLGWTDLANHPGELATRTQLLERAETLVSTIRRTAADLGAVEAQAKVQVDALATNVNEIAAEIATLNSMIATTPAAANDLLDRRQLLVGALGELVGARSQPTEGDQIDVYIGGRAIVAGANALELESDDGVLRWAMDAQAVNGASGEAAALSATINEIVPRYRDALDEVAESLVTQVNAIHTAGYGQDGTNGRTFFDPTGVTAGTIALSGAIVGQPENIAAGAPTGGGAPGPLDGEQARQLAALAEADGGPDEMYQSLIGTLAVETRGAIRRADIQEQITDAALRDADSVGAVSIDEEMAALVASQRAYEAAARFLTVVDDMLGVLIERTGVVGR